MNKLSVMLWLSDFLPALGVLGGMLGTVGVAASSILTACGVLMYSDDTRAKEEVEAARLRCVKAAWRLWPVALFSVAVCVATPSKMTVMAIAASEASGMALQSEDGKEITNDALSAVKAWLKAQIKEQAGK